jgi:acetoin utilization protein AcuC
MAQGFMPHRSMHVAGRRSPPMLVASEHCRRRGFGSHHPLSIPRVATVLELCERLGWLGPAACRLASPADVQQLEAFHEAGYVEALRRSDSAGHVERLERERYGFGTAENPLFEGVFQRAATAVGGSILAAELALEGRVVFHPAGGTHHGRPGRASGFCYFNDPVFAIRRLEEAGVERVLYVDLDAHHGDGVQDAFEDDPRVRFVSIHETGRWPHTGTASDTGRGYACNLPVPAGFNDSEFELLMAGVLLPLAERFAPEAVVITCGTDALAGDPLSRLELSNVALWGAVEQLASIAGPVVVLGGGGYNPWTLARCWTGLWGRLSGRAVPSLLPVEAQAVLRGLECDLVDEEDVRVEWFTTLADAPAPGPVREAVRELVREGRALHGLA